MTNEDRRRRERLARLVVAKASTFDSCERHKIWVYLVYRKTRRHCLNALPVMAQGVILGVMTWLVTGGDEYLAAIVYSLRIAIAHIPLGAKVVQNP